MAGAAKRAGTRKAPARRAAPTRSAALPARKAAPTVVVHAARPAARIAVPEATAPRPAVEEPVWLVRIVLVLFFVGFAAFLAREVYSFVQSLP